MAAVITDGIALSQARAVGARGSPMPLFHIEQPKAKSYAAKSIDSRQLFAAAQTTVSLPYC